MATFVEEVTIDFTDLEADDDAAREWIKGMRMKPEEIEDLTVKVSVDISISQFGDDELREEFESRFPELAETAPRIYALLADGEVNLAMDEMSRAFDLPSPDHAKRVAATIARGRQGALHV